MHRHIRRRGIVAAAHRRVSQRGRVVGRIRVRSRRYRDRLRPVPVRRGEGQACLAQCQVRAGRSADRHRDRARGPRLQGQRVARAAAFDEPQLFLRDHQTRRVVIDHNRRNLRRFRIVAAARSSQSQRLEVVPHIVVVARRYGHLLRLVPVRPRKAQDRPVERQVRPFRPADPHRNRPRRARREPQGEAGLAAFMGRRIPRASDSRHRPRQRHQQFRRFVVRYGPCPVRGVGRGAGAGADMADGQRYAPIAVAHLLIVERGDGEEPVLPRLRPRPGQRARGDRDHTGGEAVQVDVGGVRDPVQRVAEPVGERGPFQQAVGTLLQVVVQGPDGDCMGYAVVTPAAGREIDHRSAAPAAVGDVVIDGRDGDRLRIVVVLRSEGHARDIHGGDGRVPHLDPDRNRRGRRDGQAYPLLVGATVFRDTDGAVRDGYVLLRACVRRRSESERRQKEAECKQPGTRRRKRPHDRPPAPIVTVRETVCPPVGNRPFWGVLPPVFIPGYA